MKQSPQNRIRDLIERISRLNSADDWSDALNPTQWAALSYLSQANRFSRAPSQVAEFMSATRGTVSQTLKALARKGLITEIRSTTDRRWISYDITTKGIEMLDGTKTIDHALQGIDASIIKSLEDGLESLLREALVLRGRKQFGQCQSCRYHRKEKTGGHCKLLNEALKSNETRQICHEYLESARIGTDLHFHR